MELFLDRIKTLTSKKKKKKKDISIEYIKKKYNYHMRII